MDKGVKHSHIRRSYRRLGQFQRRQIRLEILRRAAAEVDPLDINGVDINKRPKKIKINLANVGTKEKTVVNENAEEADILETEEIGEENQGSPKFELVVSPTLQPSYHVELDDVSQDSDNFAHTSDEYCKNIKQPDASPITPELISPSTKMELLDDSVNPGHSILTNGDEHEYDYEMMPGIDAVLRAVREMQNDTRQQFREITLRLDNMEELLTRELSSEFPPKPDCLPLRTRKDLTNFEKIDAEEYNRVVDYLGRLSNGSLNETCVTVFKAAFCETLAPIVTIHGAGEARNAKLDGTRFLKALYAAVAKNRTYEKPTWKLFLDLINNALRATKQRLRRAQLASPKP